MPQITINNQTIDAPSEATILEAAMAAGIAIPTLCYHPNLSVAGSCRLCMVEIEGSETPVAACTTLVAQRMAVQTDTESLFAARRLVLKMLLTDYVDDDRQSGPDNEFHRLVRHHGLEIPSDHTARRRPVDDDPNPFIRVDMNQCILCTRCVRACEEIQGRFVWGVANRGHETEIIAGLGSSMLDARCESCGACSALCPTGALTDRLAYDHHKNSAAVDPVDKKVRTTCSYCGVGCQFDLNVRDDRIVQVTSTPEAPVNGVSLCVKGRYGFDYVHHADRLLRPRVRKYLLDNRSKPADVDHDDWVEVDWPEAIQIVAQGLSRIRLAFGPDAIGVFASAKCTNEENYLMQKFARAVIGTNNIDHCARLCHSSSVAALRMCLGSGAMSNSMADIVEHAQALFIIGANPTEQHPVFAAKLRQAILRRNIPLVVADPRRIDITEFAKLHLRHRPGTDTALLNGLMHIILENGWHDEPFIRQRCEDFEQFAEKLAQYPPKVAAEITGVSTKELHQAAEILALNKPMATMWGMGITQHIGGVLSALSLGNLQMLLGNLGKPGSGLNPLRGQNNVQGACDMGSLPDMLPGYQMVSNPVSLEKFVKAWELESPRDDLPRREPSTGGNAEQSLPVDPPLSNRPGLTMTELVHGLTDQSVRGLYIVGENPVMTEPDCTHARASMQQAEFIVVQDIFPTETSRVADVLLPATSFAEKDGTFTNTERRVQMVRPAIRPRGESRTDWQILAELAREILNLEQRVPVGEAAAWNYESTAQIMDEIASLTPSYAGVHHWRIERGDQLQWPVPNDEHPGTPFLYEKTFTRGKGKFHAVDHLPAAELPDDDYPLLLTTGRVLYHWHGGEMTRRASGLLDIYPESLVEICAEDATRLSIRTGDPLCVSSRRGEMVARAVITDRVASGVVFGNFHFPEGANVNNLTICALDPIAKIPEFKVCAVRVNRAVEI